MNRCSGPKCSRPASAEGLCMSHYRQKLRDPARPLRPLREPGLVLLPGTALYVHPETLPALEAEGGKQGIAPSQVARDVLDRWAKRRR